MLAFLDALFPILDDELEAHMTEKVFCHSIDGPWLYAIVTQRVSPRGGTRDCEYTYTIQYN